MEAERLLPSYLRQATEANRGMRRFGKVPPGFAVKLEGAGLKNPKNYAVAVRDFALTLVHVFEVPLTDFWHACQSHDVVAYYAAFRAEAATTPPGVTLRKWKNTTQAAAVSLIPTALRFFGLPAPPSQPVATARVARALLRATPWDGVKSRPAITMAQAAAVKRGLLRQGTHAALRAAALLDIMLYNLMRPGDAEAISVATQIEVKQGGTLVLLVHDKTNIRRFRQICITAIRSLNGLFDSTDSFRLAYQYFSANRLHKLFDESTMRILKAALKHQAATLTAGTIRPGGVVLHMHLRSTVQFMKKLAGWSDSSTIWMQHYFDVGSMEPPVQPAPPFELQW